MPRKRKITTRSYYCTKCKKRHSADRSPVSYRKHLDCKR